MSTEVDGDGIQRAAINSTFALGPLAAALIMDRYDPRWVWYGCAILCAVSMAGFWLLHLRAGGRLAARQAAPVVASALAPAPAADWWRIIDSDKNT